MSRRGILLLAGTTLLGAVLRIVSPGRVALFRDEMQALNIAGLPSLAEITRFLYRHESHPPLFYFLEHLAGRMTGAPIRATGIITLVASVALIPAAWWLASLSRVRGAATLASSLIAVSVPLSFFNVELRPYALLSLAVLLGTAAILQDRATPSLWWRLLWAVTALSAVYLHHVGTLVVAVQLVTAILLVRPNASRASYGRRLDPVIGIVVLGAVPAFVMLAHQAAVAGYPPRQAGAVWGPLRDFADLMFSFAGEIGLGLFGAVACLLWAGRQQAPVDGELTEPHARKLAALQFVLICGLLTVASYRSNLLLERVVLSVVPLGLVSAAIAITTAVKHRWRWRSVILSELAIAGVVLSTLGFLGKGKTDTDLVAAYVGAEALSTDLLILEPGVIGPSFNHYFSGRQQQIDFPEVGGVSRFRFDRYAARVESAAALHMVRDSILSACRAGRRVWLVAPVEQPENDVAQLLIEVFGAPQHVSQPSPIGVGTELLRARVWGHPVMPAGSETGPECLGQ
jgi:hypothetical protein